MALAVELRGVTKRYTGHVAVSGLSLEVPAGTVFGLLGPNGAGKTTTIRILNDIIAADEGEVRLFEGLPPGRAAARRIGYLPEERGLYPKMRVDEALVFFAELRGVPRREAARRAEAWLERLDLTAWRRRKVEDLSKGMQQKVQFITAVLHQPDLLILDEPWSGLDPVNADLLVDIVNEEKQKGRTILFSTHIIDHAERLCDRVAIICRARLLAEGTVAELRRAGARESSLRLALRGPGDDERAAAVLADPALVAAVERGPDHARVDLAAGATPQGLLERLVAAGAAVRRFELLEPSLHQVFVDRVTAAEKEAAQ